jgi:hypothetical protein
MILNMNEIDSKKIIDDTPKLYKEYCIENKQTYEELFNKYFGDVNFERNNVYSNPIRLYNFCWDIWIYIDRHPSPVKTYFCSGLDLHAYTSILRQDPLIRKLIKLCFYIENEIKPYNSIDKDLER